ncbi:MAG: hypothetical protein ACE5K7_04875 [Phycisphaerae bacterium]
MSILGRWVWAGVAVALLVAAPLGCQDTLNPQFLARLGESSAAMPQPGSNVVLLLVNQTFWPAEANYQVITQSGATTDVTQSLAAETFVPIAYECGVSQFVIQDGTVFTVDGDETATFPGGPLDVGFDFVCGAVIKIFIYATVDNQGNIIYEIASETVLD